MNCDINEKCTQWSTQSSCILVIKGHDKDTKTRKYPTYFFPLKGFKNKSSWSVKVCLSTHKQRGKRNCRL